ncbi:MAG: hypothetical protein ABSG41_28265 [Bryobacteraceae bacterium]|jgi:hypothetical protein
MKLATALIVALSAASFAPAQSTTRPLGSIVTTSAVRHIIGLDAIKRNASGKLTVQDGVLEFNTGKAGNKVPVASIDDIFIGTESTQARGTTATVAKTAAIAAPFESGRALTILMRTKVDILTVSYHDPDGALHGAIFALPIGQAEQTRAQLIQAGAHASPAEK